MMNIYCFTMNIYGDMKIKRRVFEVEEKPKTYSVLNQGWRLRINKSDIGVITGNYKNKVYLLEDDFEKAKKILVEELNRKIRYENDRIKGATENIHRLERNIAEIENMESAESEES